MGWEYAAIAVEGYNEISGSSLTYDQAKKSLASTNKMLANLNRQKEELAKAYSTREKIATDIYGNKVEDAYYKANRSLKDINRRYDSGTSQSGLAYSGTLYEASREGTQGVRHELTSTKRDLENQLGQTLADIMVKKTTDMQSIDNTMLQLEGQKGILKEQIDDSWWSTNIGGKELKWYWDKSFLSDIF